MLAYVLVNHDFCISGDGNVADYIAKSIHMICVLGVKTVQVLFRKNRITHYVLGNERRLPRVDVYVEVSYI